MIHLITGGVKSGKSNHALKIALSLGTKRVFIATAQPFDEEMALRIEKHKKKRDKSFITIEEPVELSRAINSCKKADVCVIDCITVWIGNLMHYKRIDEIEPFIEALKKESANIIIVTNEVGMGIVPADKISREYADILGTTNQRIAALSDKVTLMVSGIAVPIKT